MEKRARDRMIKGRKRVLGVKESLEFDQDEDEEPTSSPLVEPQDEPARAVEGSQEPRTELAGELRWRLAIPPCPRCQKYENYSRGSRPDFQYRYCRACGYSWKYPRPREE